jgi:AraC family transcriptional regulator of adaptative response / methylphosphotriester-DNA alkyltransferase methyltransferase
MKEEFWRAIVECDPRYDGHMYYGLLTTGIFCKPSCKSRTPKRENVRIFYTPEEAKNAGLRPCKRCRPDDVSQRSFDKELAERLTQLIDECYHEPLTLQEMASRLFVSPFYLQKCFSRIKHMSPAKYLTLKRVECAKHLLAESQETITSIALQVGFRSSAHFSSVFHKETGHSPTGYRNLMKTKSHVR